jgi:predicted amidohydrolase
VAFKIIIDMILTVAQTHPHKGDILKNIKQHKRLIDLAVSYKADTIIFPELSLTGYEPELAKTLAMSADDNQLDCFQDISNDKNITIGVGIPLNTVHRTPLESEGITISMVIFRPHKSRQVYSKKYLHSSEMPFFVDGQNETTFIEGTKTALAICYELSVPQHAEDAAKNGAEYYIASVVEDTIDKAIGKLSATAAKHKMTVLMANAVGQTGAYLCDGKSSVWDNEGKLIGQLDTMHEGLLVFNTETKKIVRVLLKKE